MSVTLRNVSGEPLYLGSPTDGRRLEPGELLEVDGELCEGPADAFVVGWQAPAHDEDDPVAVAAADQVVASWRAFPKSTWDLATPDGDAKGGDDK